MARITVNVPYGDTCVGCEFMEVIHVKDCAYFDGLMCRERYRCRLFLAYVDDKKCEKCLEHCKKGRMDDAEERLTACISNNEVLKRKLAAAEQKIEDLTDSFNYLDNQNQKLLDILDNYSRSQTTTRTTGVTTNGG